MTRSRQVVGGLLILLTLLAAVAGEPYVMPFGGEVVDNGSYAPLPGVPQTIDHGGPVLNIRTFGLDRGGLFLYGLILWTALGRYLHGAAAFCLGVLATVTAVLLHVSWVWYGVHLLATAGMGAVLADAARRERVTAEKHSGHMAASGAAAVCPECAL